MLGPMPPRVALLAPFASPSVRGNAVTVTRVARGLRERNVELSVWDLSLASEGAVEAEVEATIAQAEVDRAHKNLESALKQCTEALERLSSLGSMEEGEEWLHLTHLELLIELDMQVEADVVAFGALETDRQSRAREPFAHAAQFGGRTVNEKRRLQSILQMIRRALVVDQPHADAIGLRVYVEEPTGQSSHKSSL